MKTKKPKVRPFMVHLPADLHARLLAVAHGRFTSGAEFVRQAVREKLDREETR